MLRTLVGISPETFLLPPFSISMLFATETPKINGGAHYKKKNWRNFFGDRFVHTALEVVRKVPAFPLERFFLLGQQKKRFFFSRFFFFPSTQPTMSFPI